MDKTTDTLMEMGLEELSNMSHGDLVEAVLQLQIRFREERGDSE